MKVNLTTYLDSRLFFSLHFSSCHCLIASFILLTYTLKIHLSYRMTLKWSLPKIKVFNIKHSSVKDFVLSSFRKYRGCGKMEFIVFPMDTTLTSFYGGKSIKTSTVVQTLILSPKWKIDACMVCVSVCNGWIFLFLQLFMGYNYIKVYLLFNVQNNAILS